MTGVGGVGASEWDGRGGLESSMAPHGVYGRVNGTYGRDTVWNGRSQRWRAGALAGGAGWKVPRRVGGEQARLGRRRAAMDARKLSELRAFVRLCKQNPGLLHTPELAFLREWVERSVPGRGRRRP